MQDVFSYYAFISYKHEDEKYARWLQKRLESYRLPSSLQNEGAPERIRPVFRDQTDLTPGQPLKDSIKDKLRLSKYLIVICSKNLARGSEYVDYEINSFVEMGRADRIIPVIIDGEPFADNPENECFCDALKKIPGEILAGNSEKDGRRIASLKVIAAILQLNADDLIKRDERRKKKKNIIVAILSAVLFMLSFLAVNTIFDLTFASNSEEAIYAYNKEAYADAVDYAVKAINVPGKKDERMEAEAILRGSVITQELKNSNEHFYKDYEIEFPNESIALYGESKDGSKVAFSDGGTVWIYDFKTGEKIAVYNKMTEKKALDEFLDPVKATDDMIRNTEGGKTESEKYIQSESAGTFSISDNSGNKICQFKADSSVKWIYSDDDSFVVVYVGNEIGKTYVYSFEEDFFVELADTHESIGDMWLSKNGGYIFINYSEHSRNSHIDTRRYIDVYETVSGSYITTLINEGIVGIGDRFVFSDINSETLYFFTSSKAIKYIFKDVKPDFSKAYKLGNGFAVTPSGSRLNEVHISADGKRMLTKNVVRTSGGSVGYISVYDTDSEKLLLLFNSDETGLALTPNYDICIASEDKDIIIYDTDSGDAIYRDYNYSEVTSVAINEDGSYAAYSTETGNIYILEKDGASYVCKKTFFSYDFDGETYISAMKGDRCLIYDESGSYMYSIMSDEKERFSDMCKKDVYVYDSYKNMIKSEKFLDDMLLEFNLYAAEDIYLSYNTGERYKFESILLPCAYSDEKDIFAGIYYSGQMQSGSVLRVMRFNAEECEELYTYIPSFPVRDILFDNTGKYIIVIGDDMKSEVIEAESGKKLFKIDRKICIYDDIIYDISDDIVVPGRLPESKISTIKEFKDRARELFN